MKEVARVLSDISSKNCYDGFVHYSNLQAWSKETDIPPAEWETLLDSWSYDPTESMAEQKRGNCADFAAYATRELGRAGIAAYAAGVYPTEYYNSRQQDLLGYEHALVIGAHTGESFMCEPGWNSPQPMPVRRGVAQGLGNQIFYTVRATPDMLVQNCFSKNGEKGERKINLHPLEQSEIVQITKGAMRLPNRRMSLIASRDKEPEQHRIVFDIATGLLASPLSYLPKRFHPVHISSKANHKLSAVFGFDVKEELLACYAIKEALPPNFWVE